MLHYGRRTHNNKAVFYGFEGVIMGLIMGSQNIMGSDYGSNISETAKENKQIEGKHGEHTRAIK
jgi:hypothetical protein